MSGQKWRVNSKDTRDNFKAHVDELFEKWGYVVFSWNTGKQRSDQQRKAIEVYCAELSKALSDAGLDQRKTMEKMKDGVEIPWSQSAVKDNLWRNIQRAVINKESTTRLERAEVSKVYDILNRWTSTTFGVSVPFPERDDD